MQPILVAVCSDDTLFSEGVRNIVSGDASLHLVAANDGVPDHASQTAEADVLLLDSRIADAVGLCRLLTRQAGPRVICLAVVDDQIAIRALDAGASGVLFKNAPAADVVSAIQYVMTNQIWAPRRLALAASLAPTETSVAAPEIHADRWQRLSRREREVAHLVSAGLANKEVSSRLAISEATVKTHLTRVFQKLGVRTRSELAAACRRPPIVVRPLAN